ncbi:MAG TPA: hypothetical protein VN192_03385, partial [Flavobacterium sp.]|nr:hypothetical protein [Flavobacterium sp.]
MKKNYFTLLFLIVFGFSINFAFAQKPTVSIRTISKFPLIEGNTYQFKVGLSAANNEDTVIDVSTIAETANETDYTPLTTTIIIPAGALLSNEFAIATTNDSNIEDNEIFKVNAKVTSDNTSNKETFSSIYITDNDAIPTLKTYANTAKVVEG